MREDWEYIQSSMESDPIMLFSHRDKTKLETCLAVDVNRKPIDPDNKSAACHATLDRMTILGDTAYVTDYKTNRAIWPESTIQANFQANFYSTMVLSNFPKVMTVKFTFAFLRYRATRHAEFTRFDTNIFWDNVIKPTIDAMREANQNNDFPAQPSTGCDLCMVMDRCDFWKGVPEKWQGLSDEELAEKWIAAKAFIKGASAELKQRVSDGASIKTNGAVVDFYPSESVSYPYSKVKDPLLMHTHDIEAIKGKLAFSATAIKQLLKRADQKDLINHFELEYSEKKTTTRFEPRKGV